MSSKFRRSIAAASVLTGLAVTAVIADGTALAEPFCSYKVTANPGLNLRNGPGAQYEVVGYLPNGNISKWNQPTTNGWRWRVQSSKPWGSGTYLQYLGGCVY